MPDNLTEHQQRVIQEIRQHLHNVLNSSRGFGVVIINEFARQKPMKNKLIIFSLDELRTLIKLIYKLFEVHEEV